jgi:hypothetical protein
MQFGGKWLIEIAELQSFQGADRARLKAFISTRQDNYRPPYGRTSQDFQRAVIFAGTINEHEYLSDPTGARRFWPFLCGTIKVDAIRCDRDQLWAEAVDAYHKGETWWLDDSKIVAEQEKRQEDHPWHDAIEDFVATKTETTVDEILTHLETPIDNGIYTPGPRPKIARRKADQMAVGAILRRLGWERKQVGHLRTRSWIKAATDAEPEPPSDEVVREVVLGESLRNPTGEPREPREPPTRTHTRWHPPRLYETGGAGGAGGSPQPEPNGNPATQPEPPCEPLSTGAPPQAAVPGPPLRRIGSCSYCRDAVYDGQQELVEGKLWHAHCVRRASFGVAGHG